MEAFLAIAPILLVVGALGGLLAGLFGVGGGLVIVPALYFLLTQQGLTGPTAIAIAVGTSLTSIIPTSISSLRAHHRLNNVDWTIVRAWAPFVAAGVVLGAALISYVRSPAFIAVFGLLLVLVALNKLAGQRILKPLSAMPGVFVQRITAFVIGFISAIAGVGGGATGVPTLTFYSVAIHRAVGTCAALGLAVALPGALSILLFSHTPASAPVGTFHLIYLPALLVLMPMTIVCAPFGAKLSKKLSAKLLSRLFALVLVLVGGKMLLSI